MRVPFVRVLPAAAAVLLAASLAGCSATADARPTGTPTSAATGDGVDPARLAEVLEQFPDTPPATVVSASVPLAEVLHALDVPVAGLPSTTTQHLPAALDEVPRIGTSMAPDVERIVQLAPGLVVAAESARSSVSAALADTGTPSAYLDTDSIADLKLAVKALGIAFDREDAAATVLADLVRDEAGLRALAPAAGTSGTRVLLLIGTADSFMVMSDRSFAGSLVELAGADNVAVSALGATGTYTAVDLEKVIAAAPELVLVLSSAGTAEAEAAIRAEFAARPAWQSVPAVAKDRVHALDYDRFGYTSLAGLPKAVDDLAALLR